MGTASEPITIKRYANRRIDHPRIGAYVTLDELAAMVEDKEDFVVREAKTGEDITLSELRQIICEGGTHG